MGIVDSTAVTTPYSVSRVCYATVKHAGPDFSDRPEGSLIADGQSDQVYVTDVARGIRVVPTAEMPPHRRYNTRRPGADVPWLGRWEGTSRRILGIRPASG
jgi:hypothetical protein